MPHVQIDLSIIFDAFSRPCVWFRCVFCDTCVRFLSHAVLHVRFRVDDAQVSARCIYRCTLWIRQSASVRAQHRHSTEPSVIRIRRVSTSAAHSENWSICQYIQWLCKRARVARERFQSKSIIAGLAARTRPNCAGVGAHSVASSREHIYYAHTHTTRIRLRTCNFLVILCWRAHQRIENPLYTCVCRFWAP